MPIDLQRFRLYTGVPILVDFKSIPYKDVEVLEWYRRLEWTQQVYKETDWGSERWLAAVRKEGVTHIVAPANRAVKSAGLELVYPDAFYKVYRVLPAPMKDK